jgi:hypothetical protein
MNDPSQIGNAGFAEAAAAYVSEPRLGERLAARGLLPRESVPNILRLQRRWGCRFDEVLVATGWVTPVELAEALAEDLGVAFADLTAEPPDAGLCEKEHADLYLRNLFVPWRRIGDAMVVACADPSPQLQRLIGQLYGPRTRIAVTSKFDVIRTVQRLFRDHLSHEAVFRLEERAPRFSARRIVAQSQITAALAALAVLAGAFVAAPQTIGYVLLGFLSFCYLANLIFRLVLFWAGGTGRTTGRHVTKRELAALDERDLPVFSILVPLYREANMVAQLVEGLRLLDYPAAKLDIKLILEDDDLDTIEAAKTLQLDGRFEILRVPPSQPRTKPNFCVPLMA